MLRVDEIAPLPIHMGQFRTRIPTNRDHARFNRVWCSGNIADSHREIKRLPRLSSPGFDSPYPSFFLVFLNASLLYKPPRYQERRMSGESSWKG